MTVGKMIREANLLDFDAIEKLEQQVFKIHINARPDLFVKNYFTKAYFEENFMSA